MEDVINSVQDQLDDGQELVSAVEARRRARAEAAKGKGIPTFKKNSQSKEHNAEEMFMQTVETTITPEMFDMMKPIILEIEAEHIVHEMRQ